MKREDAAKLVNKTLPGWTVVGASPIEDAAVVSTRKISPSAFTLVKKYSPVGVDAGNVTKQVKLKTNGVNIVRVRPNKQGQDAPSFTKSVVVGDNGIIGMQG